MPKPAPRTTGILPVGLRTPGILPVGLLRLSGNAPNFRRHGRDARATSERLLGHAEECAGAVLNPDEGRVNVVLILSAVSLQRVATARFVCRGLLSSAIQFWQMNIIDLHWDLFDFIP
jgi:hypothetical protein